MSETKFLAVLRVSTTQQGKEDKTGLPSQRYEINAWLKANGHKPAAREIIDVGISAADLMNLRFGNLAKEIARIRKQKTKPGSYALCFANSARLSRGVILNALNEFTGLLISGIDIVFVSRNLHISQNDDEQAKQRKLWEAMMSFSQNQQELDTLRRRAQGMHRENRNAYIAYQNGEADKPKGRANKVYCWWHKQTKNGVEIREAEAKIVRLIFDKFTREKLSLRSIAKYLNDEAKIKHPSKRKDANPEGKWTFASIKHVLKHPSVVGALPLYTQKKVENETTGKMKKEQIQVLDDAGQHLIIQDAYPAIISKSQFQEAQRLLEKGKSFNRGNFTRKNPVNIFRGLMVEGYSNYSYAYSNTGGKYNKLIYCSNTQADKIGMKTSIVAKTFETAFFEIYHRVIKQSDVFFSWFALEDMKLNARADRKAEIEEQIRELSEGNQRLLTMVEKGQNVDIAADRMESNREKIRILGLEKSKLENQIYPPVQIDKHSRFLKELSTYVESKPKREKAAHILSDSGHKIYIWTKGFNYSDRKLLNKFKAIHPELGKKVNWIGFGGESFRADPMAFLAEYVYWRVISKIESDQTTWNRGDALNYLCDALNEVLKHPLDEISEFFETSIVPEEKGHAVFMCEKPDGTFFTGTLETKSKANGPIVSFTYLPNFQRLAVTDEGDTSIAMSRLSAKFEHIAPLNEMQETASKFFNKLLKQRKMQLPPRYNNLTEDAKNRICLTWIMNAIASASV